MLFFVLSGYLVGGSVITAQSNGFWRRYSVQRLSRMWIVLLPCLVVTVVLNSAGGHTGGAAYLRGDLNPPMASVPTGGPVNLDGLTFLGTAVLLQTITVPLLGDNAVLGRLSNEFSHYALLPLFFWAGKKNQRGSRQPAASHSSCLRVRSSLLCS